MCPVACTLNSQCPCNNEIAATARARGIKQQQVSNWSHLECQISQVIHIYHNDISPDCYKVPESDNNKTALRAI